MGVRLGASKSTVPTLYNYVLNEKKRGESEAELVGNASIRGQWYYLLMHRFVARRNEARMQRTAVQQFLKIPQQTLRFLGLCFHFEGFFTQLEVQHGSSKPRLHLLLVELM